MFGLSQSGIAFDPNTDIPDLSGKVIFITGGNRGIGFHTALALAKHNPSHIYISARNKSASESAINTIQSAVPSIKFTFLPCDLTDLSSVVQCAREFTSRENRLDILFLNAGIMANQAATTAQGYEIQFGTNHVGHFLLTKLLLPTLEKTAQIPDTDVRIISVSSMGHALAPWSGIVFSELRTNMSSWFTMRRYGQSKLANILFAKELASQLIKKQSKILAVAVHPGIVRTDLYYSLEQWAIFGIFLKLLKNISSLFISPEEGAKTQLWAATAQRALSDQNINSKEANGKVVNGEYYTPIGIAGQGNRNSRDEVLARKLWNWSEGEVKEYNL